MAAQLDNGRAGGREARGLFQVTNAMPWEPWESKDFITFFRNNTELAGSTPAPAPAPPFQLVGAPPPPSNLRYLAPLTSRRNFIFPACIASQVARPRKQKNSFGDNGRRVVNSELFESELLFNSIVTSGKR